VLFCEWDGERLRMHIVELSFPTTASLKADLFFTDWYIGVKFLSMHLKMNCTLLRHHAAYLEVVSKGVLLELALNDFRPTVTF